MVVAAVVAATTIVPLGCGGDDVPLGPTPTPTPLPSPSVTSVTIVPSFSASAGFDVGAGEGGFLVAYASAAAGSTTAIYGVRLGDGGAVVDQTPFLVSVAQSGGYLSDPSWTDPAVGFDGTSYAVAYAGTGTTQGIPAAAITAVLVDPQANVGTPVDLAETAQIGTCESDVVPPPAIAGTSASFAALWPIEEGCAGGPVLDRLDGAFATPDGAGLSVAEIDGLLPPVDDQPLVSSAASVASSGTTTVATWTEGQDGASAAVVEVAVLAPSGVERVTLASTGVGFVRPAIASDGSDYLVVWVGQLNAVQGARFQPGSTPPDGPAGFPIEPSDAAKGNPRLAFGDGTYLVAWTVPAAGGSYDLQIVEVSPPATIGAVETVATGLSSADVAIAFSGDAFLITFQRAANAGTTSLEGVLIRP